MTPKKLYNKFAFLYPAVDIFLKRRKKMLAKMINGLPGGRLLEIGVGTGSHLSYYEKHKIIAIDISEKMLEHARKEKHKVPVQLLVMDGEKLSFENESFDYIVISHVLSVTENPEQMIEEAFRVLKPSGLLFILNHDTPDNALRYFDYAVHRIGKSLKIETKFHLDSIKNLDHFEKVSEKRPGLFHYFKIAVYRKKILRKKTEPAEIIPLARA
jgi:phosphatidylethanolamine/phosphatidyl-N-methylethanolamine N-methyltransferase